MFRGYGLLVWIIYVFVGIWLFIEGELVVEVINFVCFSEVLFKMVVEVCDYSIYVRFYG